MHSMKHALILVTLLASATAQAEENFFEATRENTEAMPTEVENNIAAQELQTNFVSDTSPREFDINDVKPSGNEDLDSAAQKCRELSEIARANTTKTLVIAFEGLLSYDARGTREAYTYHYKLVQGRRATPPQRYGGGYVLHGLMVPLVNRHKGGIEFLVFNEPSISGSGNPSVPETCARIWMANPRNNPDLVGRKLIILGHSYGGHAANQLVNNLNNKSPRVRVDNVVTMDARTKYGFGSLAKPANVVRWENYMHSGGISLPGYRVSGADVNESVEGTSHTTIQASPIVYDAANRAIQRH